MTRTKTFTGLFAGAAVITAVVVIGLAPACTSNSRTVTTIQQDGSAPSNAPAATAEPLTIDDQSQVLSPIPVHQNSVGLADSLIVGDMNRARPGLPQAKKETSYFDADAWARYNFSNGSAQSSDEIQKLRESGHLTIDVPDADGDAVPQIDLYRALRPQAAGGSGGALPMPSGGARPPTDFNQDGKVTFQNVFDFASAMFDGSEGLSRSPVAAAVKQVPAEFVLHPGQELWIIERPTDRVRTQRTTDDCPGSGSLMTSYRDPSDAGAVERDVPVPLKHTDVRASIAGPISSVRVTQQFANPYSSKIEAVYVFPLPDDAAVNDFVMTIGSRSIRGVIREREQAEQMYTQARAQGYHASIMTQERSNIFTQRVANIEPGEQIDVAITYFSTLSYRDSSYEFVFPMVIGPRFNPPSTCAGGRNGTATGTGIGAVPINAYGASGQGTEVQYLRPTERNGTDISLSVDLDAGVAIEAIESPSHQVAIHALGGNRNRASIELTPYDSIPNRDFVLRYRVAGGQLKGGLIAGSDSRGGFFTMVLVPPEDLKYTRRGPVEMVFVMDCSGSMEGEPLALAKAGIVNALHQLRSEDTFQIIRFADTAEFMTQRPIDATANNIENAVRYVERQGAGGGTMLLNGLEPALEKQGDTWGWSRTRYICVLTDGFLGNEPEVLTELKKRLGDSRLFTVGVGSAPNRELLNAMSRLGRGAAGYIANQQDAREVMDLFIQRVSCASLADVRIDWGGMQVTDVYPRRIPDLYVGRPVILTGRFTGGENGMGLGEVRVSGRAGGERMTLPIPCSTIGKDAGAEALPLVWARQKITDLDETGGWFDGHVGAGSPKGPNQPAIRELALKFGLMSAYTAFLAVDSCQRTSGGFGTTVAVPVSVPQGTRYDTTVSGR